LQEPFRIGGAYRIEPSLNRVTGPNGVTRLEPKMMLVLVCLAEHAGQMVSKEQLLSAAWPDTAVGDDVLIRAISELRRLFDDDSKQPRVIETIPKSGYRLVAQVGLTPAASDASAAAQSIAGTGKSRGWRQRLIAIGVTGVTVVVFAGVWRWWPARPATAPPAMRVVPLTTLSGTEYGASFSPDGRQVAFAWNGEPPGGATRPWWQGDWDIYVKLIGSSDIRQLTSGPALDLTPEWSPDGREIAYLRSDPGGPWRIRVMSALGGSDRQVSELPVMLPAVWSPDGRYLVAEVVSPDAPATTGHSLYLIPAQGGAPRVITHAPARGAHQSPAFSPDGHRLAYIACDDGATGCDVQVLDLDSTFSPVGSSRALTGKLRMFIAGLTWTRDGTSIVFNVEDDILLVNYLWRVGVDGQHPPERIEVAGANALFPSASPDGDRLAFARLLHDEDIYRFQQGQPARPVAQSSAFDGLPTFSPDGRRIAFCSARSGDGMEVWVANADGTKPEQLTHGPERYQADPSWSPDGQQIAFQSTATAAKGHPHIWTVDSEGGTPRQITRDAGDQMDPTWSRDGEWIYFSWSRPNDRDIWRIRVRTGTKEQVTHGGGFIGRESTDGTALFYIPKAATSPLLSQPLAGGAPREIVPCVAGTAFSVSSSGIFYLPCSDGPRRDTDPLVQVMNPIAGTPREVGRLEKFQYDSLPSGFAVSPDGRTILYSRLVKDEADLMLIENFK